MNTSSFTFLYQHFNIGRITYVEPIVQGFLSNNVKVANATNEYFLKRYRFTDPARVAEVHVVKQYFYHHGIPVILPVPTKTNETFIESAGHCYALFPFVHGRTIRRAERSVAALQSAATMLALLHAAGLQPDAPRIHDHMKTWNKNDAIETTNILLKTIARKPSYGPFDELAQRVLRLKHSLVERNDTAFTDLNLRHDCLVHGDYHGNNLFYNESDEVTHVFDWEKTDIAPRVYELIRAMDFMCLAGEYTAATLRWAQQYVRAYRAALPTADEEIRDGVLTYYLKKAHSLWIEKEHYVHGNTRVDGFLAQEEKMLTYYAENWQRVVDIITQ